MHQYELIIDYKDNDKYRKSFNELAVKTFGIDFEEWYTKGFWDDKYVCYSYADGDKIVSNISVNYMDIIINGEKKKAIQIATVMTDKAYRKKGLAASLMNIIISKYKKDYDLFYLSANESVLNFYPKFGFELKEETSFILPVDVKKDKNNNLRSLTLSNEKDLKTLLRIAENRKPVSKTLGVVNDKHILLFYCLKVFGDNIYYIEDKDAIVIYTIEEDTLNLFDIISCEEIAITDILNEILYSDIKKVAFQFTPDITDENMIVEQDLSNYRFILSSETDLPERFQYPQISQT